MPLSPLWRPTAPGRPSRTEAPPAPWPRAACGGSPPPGGARWPPAYHDPGGVPPGRLPAPVGGAPPGLHRPQAPADRPAPLPPRLLRRPHLPAQSAGRVSPARSEEAAVPRLGGISAPSPRPRAGRRPTRLNPPLPPAHPSPPSGPSGPDAPGRARPAIRSRRAAARPASLTLCAPSGGGPGGWSGRCSTPTSSWSRETRCSSSTSTPPTSG